MFSNSSRPGYDIFPASRIDNERCSKDNTMRSGSKIYLIFISYIIIYIWAYSNINPVQTQILIWNFRNLKRSHFCSSLLAYHTLIWFVKRLAYIIYNLWYSLYVGLTTPGSLNQDSLKNDYVWDFQPIWFMAICTVPLCLNFIRLWNLVEPF